MSSRELRRFLLIARGSNSELQTQLELAGDMRLVEGQLVKNAIGLSQEIESMLFALLKNLKNNGV